MQRSTLCPGVSWQPVWLAEPNPTEIESSDVDYGWLLDGRCDVQLSIPGQAALGAFAERLVLSEPYYGAAFELVPESATLDLTAPEGHRIAVRGNTVAHVYIDRLGFDWTMRRDGRDIASAIDDGDATAGLIWGPELGALGLPYSRAEEPPVALRWNHHAAVRAADGPLRDAIDAVFATAGFHDDAWAWMRSAGIPPHRPFPSVHGSVHVSMHEAALQ